MSGTANVLLSPLASVGMLEILTCTFQIWTWSAPLSVIISNPPTIR